MLVSIDNVDKYYGAEQILDKVSARVLPGDRIGLIGPNGAGKTTLIRVLCGLEEIQEGEVTKQNGLRIGYLKQESPFAPGATLLESMRSVFADVLEAEAEMRLIEKQMQHADHASAEYKELADRYAWLSALFDSREGFLIDVKIKTVLNGMGFADVDMDMQVGAMSGGEKTRLSIARLLLEDLDLLILDEPTNHLDFTTIMWLEDYLKSYRGAFIIVSHDRYFLDRLCTSIWEVEFRRLSVYTGNYTKYVALKQEKLKAQQKQYDKQQNEIASMEDFIARNLVRASTTNRAQSRRTALEKLERIEKPREYAKTAKLRFEFERDPVKDILTVDGLKLEVGEGKVLAESIGFALERKDRLAIIGPNGCGKTTLLKSLLNNEGGTVEWGRNTKTALFEQEHRDLDGGNTVLEELWGRHRTSTELAMRSVLGGLLFSGEDIYKKVSALSGGERARLALAVLMLKKANVLILDEPTNHLDLWVRESLENALLDFEGSIIMVSHDRYLINRLATKILAFEDGKTELYKGNFDVYSENQALRQKPKEPPAQKAKEGETVYYRSKQQRSLEAAHKKKLSDCEKAIEALEAEIEEIERGIADPANAADYQKLGELCVCLEAKKEELGKQIEIWEGLL